MLLDEDYRPTAGEAVQDLTTAAAFSAISRLIQTHAQSKAAAARLQTDVDDMRRDFARIVGNEPINGMEATLDDLAVKVARTRAAIRSNVYMGQQDTVNAINEFLDTLDDAIAMKRMELGAVPGTAVDVSAAVGGGSSAPGTGLMVQSGMGTMLPGQSGTMAPVAVLPETQITEGTKSAPKEGAASSDADMVAQDVVDRYVDHSISKSRFVDNPLITDESVADLSLGKVSDALTSKVWNEYGIDISGKNHVLTDNDIRHMYNRHGPHTPEALPVTAADIKMIPTIIGHPDDVYYLPRKDGKVGLMYRYRHNGTTFFLEQIIGDTLKSKQMIKVPTGTIPDVEGLADAIKAKSTGSLPGDAAGAVPQMYVQDVRSDAFLNSSIPQPPAGVNLRRSLPGDIPADIPPGLRKLYLLAQEMSASPPPREIPQRPIQQSPQEILTQLAREMAMDPQAREIPQRPVQQSPQEILTQLAQEMTQDPAQDGTLSLPTQSDEKSNPIENSGQYDILEETGYSIQPITEESIQKVALVQPHGLSKVQAKQLQDAHKKLLHSVMGKPAGTEACALYSVDMSAEIDYRVGEEDGQSVSIPRCAIPHIAIHNHPDNNVFSLRDLVTFLQNDKMKGITAICNSGKVFSLSKAEDYDGFLFWRDLESVLPLLDDAVERQDIDEYVDIITKLLQRSSEYGVEFIEG